MNRYFVLIAALLALPISLRAQNLPCATGKEEAIAISREWWSAFALGELTKLDAKSASRVSWTASNGRTYDRQEMLANAAAHNPKANIGLDWKEASARLAAPAVAIVTNRVIETIEKTPPATYRYLSVLECVAGRWRVAAAQSTREAALSPRTPAVNRGNLGEFVGRYVTPTGAVLHIDASGDALLLMDPAGNKTRLESVGQDLFEAAEVFGAGVVRFVFHRGQTGQIVALSRLASTIVTFPRKAAPNNGKARE